jgi:uncharacterized protein (TIGR00369 family)
MNLNEELHHILHEGTEEEKEILALAVQAIKQKRQRHSAYISGFMGLKGRFVDENEYEFCVPVTPFMLNKAGMVHGGITATLADSTIGSLINQRLPQGYKGAVTVELKVNYLKPGFGKELISRAKLVHMGSTLATATCEITNEKGKLIAFTTGTFYMIR